MCDGRDLLWEQLVIEQIFKYSTNSPNVFGKGLRGLPKWQNLAKDQILGGYLAWMLYLRPLADAV